jgi:hypothetical protein
MGLDMYLYSRKANVDRYDGDICNDNELAYWRKTNSVHRWFVENVQNSVDDCGEYEVSKDQLSELLTSVNAVLENKKLAEEILPTTRGFFFGSIDYDNWYFADLDETQKMLNKAIEFMVANPDHKVYYQSSW